MASPPARRARAAGIVPILLLASLALIAIQLVSAHSAHQSPREIAAVNKFGRTLDGSQATTSTSTAPTSPPTTSTTTTTPPAPVVQAAPAPPPPTTTTTAPPPAPAPAPTPPPAEVPAALPSAASAVPPAGQATEWGCAAALAYLTAYAYPGFTLQCPGGAAGREAMTCYNEPGLCDNEFLIAIAEACPAAYMNEASNSWVIMGVSNAPIDPYGTC